MAPNPSLNWERLQNVFYRSTLLHTLEWQPTNELRYATSLCFVAIDTGKSIQIFNYLGELLADISMKLLDTVIKFEFDTCDQRTLVVVGIQSIKVVKSWAPLVIRTINLPLEFPDVIWDYKDGVCVLKDTRDVLRYNRDTEHFELVIRNDGRYNILTKDYWDCNNNEIIILDTDHVFRADIHSGDMSTFKETNEWHKVRISNNGFVCLYNAKYNKLDICTTTGKLVLEHTMDQVPLSIQWCGDDSIACAFDDTVRLFGPNGEYVSFWYPNSLVGIVTEIDGLKVLTQAEVYLITKVPGHTSRIYRMGSTEAGSMLLDSWHMLSSHTARALDYLREFDLKRGIIDCIDAAQDEMDPLLQKELLNSASFGKTMLTYNEFDSNVFVRACDNVRLLNVLRGLGFFLTNTEYQSLGFEGIIGALLLCHKYYESIEICKQFKQPGFVSNIVQKWAQNKIQSSPDVDDAELFRDIKEHLDDEILSGGLSTAKIAQTAFAEGRFSLARSFAMIEKSPELKATALITLDDNIPAIQESLKSKCPEFVLSVLLLLKGKLTQLQLTKILIVALSDDPLYLYFQRDNYEQLFDYYRQTDRYRELAHLIFAHNRDNIIPFLPQIKDLYSNDLNDPISKQDIGYLKRNEALAEYQEQLSNTLGTDFIGMTLQATLERLVRLKHVKEWKSLVKKFKIRDKKYYHTMCRILIDEKRFEDLYNFANERKSPIGYYPFFKYLKKAGKPKEAARYVPMINEMTYQEKVKTLQEVKGYLELIQLFTKEKNILALKDLYQQIPVNEVQLRSLITQTISNF